MTRDTNRIDATNWGLEYLLLFGPPENKLELLEGFTPCRFPFETRQAAERHFDAWRGALCRWKGVSPAPPVLRTGRTWSAAAAGFEITLYPRPVDLRVPLDPRAFRWASDSFWRRALWEDDHDAADRPAGAAGWGVVQDHWDVKFNLWRAFEDARGAGGLRGRGIGGVDVSLSDADAVAPDFVFYLGDRRDCMIEGQYFRGVPDLVAEVLSASSRSMDRGARKDVYRRVGVPRLWLLDPERRALDVFELKQGEYERVACLGPTDRFEPAGFAGLVLDVDRLFDTQSSRHRDDGDGGRHYRPAARQVPAWGVRRDLRLGLEYLLVLGHAERRREIWNNRAPCVLAF